MGRSLALPAGYVDMHRAVEITGYSRDTIGPAAAAGEIPGATRKPGVKTSWRFTEVGLRQWIGIEDVEASA